MLVYQLTCIELGYTCIYDTLESMTDDLKMASEDGEGLVFEIKLLEMSREEYDKLPESGGW